MKKKIEIFCVILLAIAAGSIFFYTTEYGVGLTNDSAAYIGGARSILAGTGYSRFSGDKQPRPITQFPPLYSLTLAGLSKLSGMDSLESAKVVNLFCCVSGLVLFVLLLRQISGKMLPAILGGMAYVACGPVLQANIHGLSETLYLFIFLIILNLSYFASKKQKFGMIWFLIGLLAGALMLTRYAALAAFAALLVWAVCTLPNWKYRLSAVIQLLIGFSLPTIFWLRRNAAAEGGNALNRTITLHFPAADKLKEGIINFAGFFLPEYGGLVENHLKFWGISILLLLALLTIVAFLMALRGLFKRKISLGVFLPLLHAVAYIWMLILDALYVDGSTVFDNRMLLPFYVLSMLLIYAIGTHLLNGGNHKYRIVVLIIMVAFPLLLLEDEIDLIRIYHEDGQGFAGQSWKNSETRLAALELDQEKTIFSNRQTFLSLINDQPSYIIPPYFNAANFSERDNFEKEKQWMAEEVLQGKAYTIVFNYREMLEDNGDRVWLEDVLEGLPIYGEYNDGIIFGL